MELLVAAAVDRLSMLLWSRTEAGRNNTNRPKSVLDALLYKDQNSDDIQVYDSAEAFETDWEAITGVKHGR